MTRCDNETVTHHCTEPQVVRPVRDSGRASTFVTDSGRCLADAVGTVVQGVNCVRFARFVSRYYVLARIECVHTGRAEPR